MLNMPAPDTQPIAPASPCPCGSGSSLQLCCAPRLDGSAPTATAEQLMRSRYTAHVLCDVAYLLRSWRSPDPDATDPEAIRQWAQQSDWRGLTIHSTVAGGPADREGWVEFTAVYADKTAPAAPLHHHREKSRFIREEGQWFYVDGETLRPEKTGRNSPCPCGSGKKFKRCCGV